MIKICEACGDEFECYDKPHKARASKRNPKRPMNSKTCSTECSKIYNLKQKKIRNRIYMQNKRDLKK